MSTSDEMIRKFINGLTKEDLYGSKRASECTKRSETKASKKSVNEPSYEEIMDPINNIFFKARMKRMLGSFPRKK